MLNRRGFDFQHIKNDKFIHQGEMDDFQFCLLKIKEIYNAKIFLCGVSAGANHGAKILARFKDEVPVECFMSVSNPFNFARISFAIKFSLWGRILSAIMTLNARQLYKFHS